MSKDWDVLSYRTEHENEDHWELRKNFMLAHKDKFDEDELVCLAQVFTNIEFLGCRYPEKTMLRVAELAKGVVEQYREQRKNSLKRTFVAASDAASAKMKGPNKGQDTGPPNKKQSMLKSEEIIEIPKSQQSNRVPKYGGVKTFNINVNKKSDEEKPLGNFVLFLTPGEHPVSDIVRSASINSVVPRWDFEDAQGNLKACKLYFDDHLIASAVGESVKISKENTAIAAIANLRELYYAIQVKSKFYSDSVVSSSELNESASKPSTANEGKVENIGSKLMKLMGWGGGGLGRNEQGIEEPISAEGLQVDKRGFGYNTSEDSNLVQFKKKVKDYIRAWMNENSDQDLVFSTEFNSDERKAIHEIAKQLMLKSKSYGKNTNRHLVVSKKAGPWEIVETLMKSGRSSDKYELLYPCKRT